MIVILRKIIPTFLWLCLTSVIFMTYACISIFSVNSLKVLKHRIFLAKVILLFTSLLTLQFPVEAQFVRTPWPAKHPVPNFSWTDINGGIWTSSNQIGKVVIINFWATWCTPCLLELPTLQTLGEISDPERVSVILVNVRELKAPVQRFINASSLDLPVILDPKGEISKNFDVRIYPTTILIDPKGVAKWRIEGDVDWTSPQVNSWIGSLSSAKFQP